VNLEKRYIDQTINYIENFRLGGNSSMKPNEFAKMKTVYTLPSMDQVKIQHNIEYLEVNENTLHFDIYYPPSYTLGSKLPLVIFVFGYPDETMIQMAGCKLKEFGQYISWSKLIAASGMAAIIYETHQPISDLLEIMDYIQQNAIKLQIDEKQIGIWSCSGNVPTALTSITPSNEYFIKCAVLYYGAMLSEDNSNALTKLAETIGFEYPTRLSFNQISQNIPLLILRAGLEEMPNLNDSIDRFVKNSVSNNLPITFINNPKGHHAFDIIDNTENSREIIQQTIKFLQFHLSVNS
jgi:dienelactone hydrolase